jgi:hypothetical protein
MTDTFGSVEHLVAKDDVYSSLAARPSAASFGVGRCQIGNDVYTSNGVQWVLSSVKSFAEATDIPADLSGLAPVGTDVYAGGGTGFGKLASLKLGVVASRCGIANSYTTANKQLYSRSKHFAYDDIISLKLVLYNGYLGTAGTFENANPGTMLYGSQVEDVSGNIIGSAKFAGNSSYLAASGELVTSDWITLSTPIKSGQAFFIGKYELGSVGINYVTNSGALNSQNAAVTGTGEFMIFNNTPGTSISRIGQGGVAGATNTSQYVMSRPAAIIAMTRTRSIAIFGDSRQGYNYHNALDGMGLNGELSPSLSDSAPCLMLCYAGALIQKDSANNSIRMQLANNFCTDVSISYGISDLTSSRTATQVLADLTTLANLVVNKPVYVSTVAPKTDAGNTTPDAATNAQRVALNTELRLTPVPFSKTLDVAEIVESGTTGLWNTGYSTDGLHENIVGAKAIFDSGKIKILKRVSI